MASADDASHGGDGAPLGTGAREPTPSFDRAISGGGLRARFESGETYPRTYRDRATGDDRTRDATEKSYGVQWAQSCGLLRALEVAIWCLDIVLDALQHMERRTREERVIQSPV